MKDEIAAVPDEWGTTLLAHALAFGFLSKAFCEEPSAELVNSLVVGELFADWPLDGDNDATRAGLRAMQMFTAAWDEAQIGDLRWDYTRLFVGPGHVLAPPWESVYLSNEHLMFERQMIEVRDVYRRFGLRAPRPNAEPDDHLGLELAFVVHLCSLGLAAIERGEPEELHRILSALRDFLANHLLRWAPECLHRVVEHANTEYYRGVAHLALGALDHAASILGLEPVAAEVAA